jgi:hypothetical protein
VAKARTFVGLMLDGAESNLPSLALTEIGAHELRVITPTVPELTPVSFHRSDGLCGHRTGSNTFPCQWTWGAGMCRVRAD